MPVVYMEYVLIYWTLLQIHSPLTTETKEIGQAVWTRALMYERFSTSLLEIVLGYFLKELEISGKYVTAISWNRITFNSFHYYIWM